MVVVDVEFLSARFSVEVTSLSVGDEAVTESGVHGCASALSVEVTAAPDVWLASSVSKSE